MLCPLHRLPILAGSGDKCSACERLGLTVIECELDKQDRSLGTMLAQGYEVDFRQSHAVLVFTKGK
jgi:hypothetical protein